MKHPHIFMRYPFGKYKALTFSFDDGSKEDIWLCDILKKYNLKGTFNLNMGLLPDSEDFDFDTLDDNIFPVKKYLHRLTYNKLKELYENYDVEFACHGFTHSQIDKLCEDQMLWEILKDRNQLEKLTGCPVHGFAYPQGTYDDKYKLLKIAGIKYARTVKYSKSFDLPKDFFQWAPTCSFKSDDIFELIEEFKTASPDKMVYSKRADPMLFYIFAHSYEFNINNGFEQFERVAKEVSNNDEVWYCSNIEFYNYVKAYENLDFTLDKDVVTNNSAIAVWIYANGQTYKIEPNKTVKL